MNRLQNLSDALISEANRSDEDSDIAGPCMEALLEGDCELHLVTLSNAKLISEILFGSTRKAGATDCK